MHQEDSRVCYDKNPYIKMKCEEFEKALKIEIL
ncbi:hypothetical protein BCM20_003078 [Clostridium beijerinckii]|nr:hypothetical protein [Clostridium beijerinckii]NYC03123.1 hypothetical protein [Clostridium beijerinckii]